MEAPDKIYIDVSLDSAWGMSERSHDNEVEYTHTDVVIEKAQNFFRQSHHLFKLDGMELSAFIEEFRNYMKGE